MDDGNPLRRHLATAESGAAFRAERHAGLALIEPLTLRAEAWLRGQVGEEASWQDGALVVEMRYFPPLADAIIAEGFTFERDKLPN